MATRLVLISHPLPTGVDVEQVRSIDKGLEVIYAPNRLDTAAMREFSSKPAAALHHWTSAFSKPMMDSLPRAEVIFGQLLPVDVVARAPALRWVANVLSGSEHLKPMGIPDGRITVTCSRGVAAGPIAEFAMLQLLMLFKRAPERMRNQAMRNWKRLEYPNLRGATLGLVGFGEIGSEVARLARAFGMHVIATRRRPPDGIVPPLLDALYPVEDLHAMLGRCDAVVLAMALTSQTRKLMGKSEFAAMKKGAFLVNVSRGEAIDEQAFEAAIRSGHLGGAALDVFADEPLPAHSPLWDLPNVLVSPHNAMGTNDHQLRAFERFIDNLGRYLRQEPLLYRVDPATGY